MTIRIVLIGAESTGKSTLGLELSAHYGAPLTAEFVRRYASDVERELWPKTSARSPTGSSS